MRPAALTFAACAVLTAAQAQTIPAVQLPPDMAAYKAAVSLGDNAQRIQALEAFVKQYPKSKRVARARSAELKLLLAATPRDAARVHAVAAEIVAAAGADGRAGAENSVAYELAEAKPNGEDLHAAEEWVRDAVDRNTYPKYLEDMHKAFGDAKAKMPPDAEIHTHWAASQAAYLQTLADVYLREGKLPEASAALDKAFALDPTEGAIYTTRGEIAHLQGKDADAIAALMNTEVYGGITPRAGALLKTLYAAQHNGDASGLDDAIDARYRAVYPAADTATPHTVPAADRTVLLELYTGSGCAPCVAADLAFERVLQTYPRAQVVALAFDQHIPEPDPLTNPSSVARGEYNSLAYTPTFRTDGVQTPDGASGSREVAGKAYDTVAAAVDKDLAVTSGAALMVSAQASAGTVTANATLQVKDPAVLRTLLTSGSTPAKADKAATKKSTGDEKQQPEATPFLVLNFALVQREVRYTGENGIRFHAMVVRALARPSAAAYPVGLTGSSSASASFDLAAVQATNSAYLADFEKHSERFGVVEFLSTDTHMPLDELAVAAWVEDTTTHKVVAAAFAPVQAVAVSQ